MNALLRFYFSFKYCLGLGGHLAEIRTIEEERSLDDNLPDAVYWIGLTDEFQEGEFRWFSDLQVKDQAVSE